LLRDYTPTPTLDITERFFTLDELAGWWNVRYDCIRRVFKDEPGVLKIGRPRKGKHRYFTYRVPESVAKRVYDRLTNGGHYEPR
jgi:hypothetical protein